MLLALVCAAALALPAWAATGAKTNRVSISSAGVEGNDFSGFASDCCPSLSADGRFVAFDSDASSLVGNDGNGVTDVYLRDRLRGKTTRVSVSSGEKGGNGLSFEPSVSADGRFVAFSSEASNLVGNDGNGADDVFVRDRKAGKTRRISVNSAGEEGNGASFGPSISADGRFVAFHSNASNLVGNDGNGFADVFVRDRKRGTTRRVSVSSAGLEGNEGSFVASISADGRFVVFNSRASNLTGSDGNGFEDIFLRDRKTGKTVRVSVSSTEAEGNGGSADGSVSASGRFVAFGSSASNLVGNDGNGFQDVFLRDRQRGTTRRVSVSSAEAEANGDSFRLAISASGRFIVFESGASNLIGQDANGFADVFLRDRKRGATRRVSVGRAGGEADGASSHPSISADARFVVFASAASNLVRRDTNALVDVFVRGPLR